MISFVIILDKDKHQWPAIQSRIPKVFSAQPWTATQGRDLTPKELATFLTPRALYDLPRPQCSFEDLSSVGAIGCYLSHRYLWQHMIKHQIPEMVIFEDDVVFNVESNEESFTKSFFKYYTSLPKNWEVFFLGYKRPPSTRILVGKFLKGTGFFTGTQSYLLNLSGAKKLFTKSLPMDAQLDMYIGALTNPQQEDPLLAYFTPESLTSQSRSVWHSNIQRISGAKALLPRSPVLLLLLLFLLGLVFLFFGWQSKRCPPCQINLNNLKRNKKEKALH